MIILAADPASTSRRIAERGAHSRFETDLELHQREAELYHETAARMTAAGRPLITVDATSHQPEQLAAQLGPRIVALTRRPDPPPFA